MHSTTCVVQQLDSAVWMHRSVPDVLAAAREKNHGLLAAGADTVRPRLPMKILRRASALPPDTAACIGAFDGLHLGHRALMRCAAAQARHVALVTFEPHPAQVLAPSRAPEMLQSPDQRIRVCTQIALDTLVLLPFSRAVAALSPAEFVDQFLIRGLQPSTVVVGPDFRFGAGRAGGLPQLRQLLTPVGIQVCIPEQVQLPGGACKLGSSQIREAVKRGHMDRAREMLGRYFAVAGEVVRGHQRGRQLGFRTANLQLTPGLVIPKMGVYAVFMTIVSSDQTSFRSFPAVANLGVNPTFGDGSQPTLEVHAIGQDFGEDLYRSTLEVAFVRRLRDEQRFSSPEALREQITADVATASQLLQPEAQRWIAAAPLQPGAT